MPHPVQLAGAGAERGGFAACSGSQRELRGGSMVADRKADSATAAILVVDAESDAHAGALGRGKRGDGGPAGGGVPGGTVVSGTAWRPARHAGQRQSTWQATGQSRFATAGAHPSGR